MPTIEVLGIIPARKPACLAEAKVKITLEDGEFLVIDDLRILRNRNGVHWVALPTYSIKEGQGWRYSPTVELSRALRRQLEDTVLTAYEAKGKAVQA